MQERKRSTYAGSFERHLIPAESRDPKSQGAHNSGYRDHREGQEQKRNKSEHLGLQQISGMGSIRSYPQAIESILPVKLQDQS